MTKEELKALTERNIFDNCKGIISAEMVREVVFAIIDSYQLPVDKQLVLRVDTTHPSYLREALKEVINKL